jgi:hypothetical protein
MRGLQTNYIIENIRVTKAHIVTEGRMVASHNLANKVWLKCCSMESMKSGNNVSSERSCHRCPKGAVPR